MVHTAETTRIRYFLDLLMAKTRPVMLVGNAGTGKTVLVGDKFASMDEDYMVCEDHCLGVLAQFPQIFLSIFS